MYVKHRCRRMNGRNNPSTEALVHGDPILLWTAYFKPTMRGQQHSVYQDMPSLEATQNGLIISSGYGKNHCRTVAGTEEDQIDVGRRMWRTGWGQVSGEWDEQQKIA